MIESGNRMKDILQSIQRLLVYFQCILKIVTDCHFHWSSDYLIVKLDIGKLFKRRSQAHWETSCYLMR